MAPLNIRLPPVMLPVVTVKLEPVIAAPVIAPVAEINPPVRMLPPVILPAELSKAGLKLPAVRLLVTIMLLPTILPVADIPVVPSSDNAMKPVLECIYGA